MFALLLHVPFAGSWIASLFGRCRQTIVSARPAPAILSVLKEWLDVDDAANPDAPGIKAHSMVYDDRQGCVLVLPGDAP